MRNSTGRRLGHLLMVALISGMVAVPAAFAQDSSSDPSAAQYDPPIPDPGASASSQSSGDPSGDPGGLEANIGSLPFTGIDLLIVVGVALVLTGTGLALRRLSTPRGPYA